MAKNATHAMKHGQRRIFNHGQSSLTRDIGGTLALKQDGLFLLTDASGAIPPQTEEEDRGLGLYFHDMRHLDRATLTVNGTRLTTLLATSDLGYVSVCESTNPELALGEGRTLPKNTVGLRWERRLDEAVHERLVFRNFGREEAALILTLTYDAHFDDMFTVRGAEPGKRGTLHAPTHTDDTLNLAYDGADSHHRTTTITFDPDPDTLNGHAVTYHLHLAPNETRTCTVTIAVADHTPQAAQTLETRPHPVNNQRHEAHVHADQGSVSGKVFVETSNVLFNRILRRSFLDLAMLAMRQGDDRFYAAGVPWYVALFGRDSLVTALEMLAYEPNIARNTLEILARYQGTKEDVYRDEEPGKILHELRVGEQANLHEVPSTPYYGSVDATPLWLILLGEYVRWTGDLDFFKGMHGHVAAALAWIGDYGDSDGDGFLDYASKSHKGLANQGWKDSGNSIVNADESIVTPPVALVEVQGYVYRARQGIAAVYQHAGDGARAQELAGASGSIPSSGSRIARITLRRSRTMDARRQLTPPIRGRRSGAASWTPTKRRMCAIPCSIPTGSFPGGASVRSRPRRRHTTPSIIRLARSGHTTMRSSSPVCVGTDSTRKPSRSLPASTKRRHSSTSSACPSFSRDSARKSSGSLCVTPLPVAPRRGQPARSPPCCGRCSASNQTPSGIA